MPSPSVHATTADLDAAHAGGTSVLGGTRSLISDLNNRISLMMETFQGVAAGAFVGRHAEWNMQMRRLTDELERILNATKFSADRQRQLEADSQAAINRVQ